MKILISVFIFLVSLQAQFLFAEEMHQGQSLNQAANDPTASLMSVLIQNIYTGAYHNLADEEGNKIQLRPVVPFKTGKLNHIARATLPFITESPSGETGMGDLVLFDLLAF